MGSFKQAEIDYSGLDNPNCAHYVNPQTKKAVTKYNPETGIYKLWRTRRHDMLFDTIDVYNDIAKGNKMLYANIMLLISHTGTANLITIKKNGKLLPANSEQGLMNILNVKKSKWAELKPTLFGGDLPILGTTKHTLGKKTYTRYFLNPLLTVYYKGISIVCYLLFREYLKDFLSESDFRELEFWANAYIAKEEEELKEEYKGFLRAEVRKYEKELELA